MKNGLRAVLISLVLIFASAFLIDSDWEVSHQIVIAADTALVWDVLVDLERYPEWNHYSSKVTGRVAVGEVVWVEALVTGGT